MSKNIVMILAVIVAMLAGWLVVQVATLDQPVMEGVNNVAMKSTSDVVPTPNTNVQTSLVIPNNEVKTTLIVE